MKGLEGPSLGNIGIRSRGLLIGVLSTKSKHLHLEQPLKDDINLVAM